MSKKGKKGDADKDNEPEQKNKVVEDLPNELIKTHLAQPEEEEDSNVELSSSSEDSVEENEDDWKPKAKEHGTPIKKGTSTPQQSSSWISKKNGSIREISMKTTI